MDVVAVANSSAGGRGRWFRVNLWLHRWSSLVATPFFLILCITGTVLIFHEEIDAALGYVPAAKQHSVQAPPRPLSDSVAAVQAAYPGDRIAVISREPDEHPGMLNAFVVPKADTGFERGKPVWVDIATTRILPAADPDKTPTGVFLELHSQWFLGPAGELVGALIALLVLVSLISGIVVYAPYARRIAFGVLRRGRGPRLIQLDLHNFVGCVVLGWLLVVTFTGFCLGFGSAAQALWSNTELKALKTQLNTGRAIDHEHPSLSIDRALAAAEGAQPGWAANSIVFPNTDLSTSQHYTVLLFGPKGVQQRMFRIALVEADSGKVADVRSLPAYLKIIQLSQPLHFGDYGGTALKILWVVCSWLALFITGNGAWLWWNRRRRGKTVSSTLEVTA
jgi:uncharacterized iron-regulated membrane protein